MNFCYKTASIWQVVGYIFFILKIVIPLIIIILGIVNLAKAVTSNDDKAVSKAAGTLIKKIVIGVVIFFIPTIVGAVFRLLGLFVDYSEDFNVCRNCILSPNACDTSYQGVIPTDTNNNQDTIPNDSLMEPPAVENPSLEFDGSSIIPDEELIAPPEPENAP